MIVSYDMNDECTRLHEEILYVIELPSCHDTKPTQHLWVYEFTKVPAITDDVLFAAWLIRLDRLQIFRDRIGCLRLAFVMNEHEIIWILDTNCLLDIMCQC